LTFIITGTALRISINELLFEAWLNKKRSVISLSYLAYFMIGLAWTIHFYEVQKHFGPSSMQTMYLLLIMGALVTGASTSLQAQPRFFYLYLVTLTIGAVFPFIHDKGPPHIFLNIFLFSLISLAHYRVSHTQLEELVLLKIKMNSETEKLKNFIDTAPGFVGLISKDHICYLANQITTDLYPNIIGSKIGNLDPTSEWEKFVIDFIESDKIYDVGEHYSNLNGNDIHALMRVRKLDDGGAIVVSLPINELIEARRLIREQEAKAIYASKLASLGEMAAGVAHEVNNPLTIIQGASSIIGKLVEKDPVDRETLKVLSSKLVDTTNRISKTVRSLKALSRNGESDPMEAVYISKVLEVCLDLSQQHMINNKIELRYPPSIPDLKVNGREVQLSQVLINLLNNAVDAVKKQETKWIEVRVDKIESWAQVLVIDSGPGIPNEIREKIMEPFFTTKDVNEGTGLGLSISKAIMTEHKGEISFLSDMPHTTFRLRIPLLS
jgi:signal transduction histidine kinase